MSVQHIKKSVLLPYQYQQVFELVADVDSYQHFLPFCDTSRVIEENKEFIVGEVRVHMSGFREVFITRNTMERHHRIGIECLEGPFSEFQGEWTFIDLGVGCKASLDITYQLRNRVLHLFVNRLSDMIVNHILHAFSERASSQLTPCE